MQVPLLVPFMYGVILLFLLVLLTACVRWTVRLLRIALGGRAIPPFQSLLAAVLLAALLFGTVWTLLDLPCLISGDLEYAAGTVVEHDSAGQSDISDSRGFTILDAASGERISVFTIHTPIYPGEFYEVWYLPHTRIGFIAE